MIDRSSSPQPVERLPERSEHKPERDLPGFADWLAREAPQPRLPILADGSPPPESAHPIPDQARVFNEDGFFAAPLSAPQARTGVPNAAAVTVPVRDVVGVTELALDSPSRGDLPAAQGRIAGNLVATPAPSRTPRAPGLAQAIRAVSEMQPTVIATESQVDLAPPAEAESVSISAARVVNARWQNAGAQSALRVATRDVERGLQILVAARTLSEDERTRLVNEVAALLSRHGLVPREVRIASPAHAGNSGKS